MRSSNFRTGWIIALLSIGSAVTPFSAVAHTEGVEAADPATPSALLGLRSAAGRYVRPDTAPTAWREIFTGDREPAPMTGERAGASEGAGHMMHHDSATMQQ